MNLSRLSILILLAGACVSTISCPAQTPKSDQLASAASSSDTADVQHLIDAYHAAVVSHDGQRLSSLFLPEGSFWLNVLSDEAVAKARAKVPNASRVRIGSYADFAKLVSTTKSALDPTHTNMVIHSDGTIASLYFDFIFLSDGKEQNRGSETWVMVKTDQGWRIAGITFSSHPRL